MDPHHQLLRTADDFRRVVVEYAAEAARFGAVYIEGIFSPAERVQRGVGWDEVFTGYTEGVVEAYERFQVTVNLTPDIYRGLDPELAEECARYAVRYRDRGVVGFGLGGSEARPRPRRTRGPSPSPATAGSGWCRTPGSPPAPSRSVRSSPSTRRASATVSGRSRIRAC